MMTSSQKSKIFGEFLRIFLNFSQKFTKSGQKFSTFQGIFYLNEGYYIISMASHKSVVSWSGFSGFISITKLHRSSWMSHVLQSATWLFLKCRLLQRQVLGQRIQRSQVNLLCGKFSRAVATCLCLAFSKI